MKTWMLIILGFIAINASAQSGRPSKAQQQSGITVVGNGGDVVDCGEDKPLLLLDVYELINFPDINPNKFILPRIPGNEIQKLNAVLERVKRKWSKQAHELEQVLVQFDNNMETTTEELPDKPDSLHIVFPTGCKVRQIVLQDRKDGISHFKMNITLWNRLDENHRVALRLHEAVYAKAIDEGQTNSISTRKFNGYLLSSETSHNFEDLDTTRASLNFLTKVVLKNGDILTFRGTRYFGEITERTNGLIYPCGLQTKAGIHIPCTPQAPEMFMSLAEGNISQITKASERASVIHKAFNLPFDAYRIRLDKPEAQIESNAPYAYEFDGSTYYCLGEVKFLNEDFTPGKGYVQHPRVVTCEADIKSEMLPVRFTKRLPNLHERYIVTFFYDKGRPAGIGFVPHYNTSRDWRIGFTPNEDLKMRSYFEYWNEKILKVDAYRARVKIQGECEFWGEITFSMKKRFPYVLSARTTSDNSCTLTTPQGDLKLTSFTRDENGHLLTVESASELPFKNIEKPVKIRGPVDFNSGFATKGNIQSSTQALYKGHMRWLPPDEYKSDNNGGVEGAFYKSGDTIVISGFGIEQPYRATVPKSSGDDSVKLMPKESSFYTSTLELLKGRLAESALLPVCHFQKATEEIETRIEKVEAGKWIQSRKFKTPSAPHCFWTLNEEGKGR